MVFRIIPDELTNTLIHSKSYIQLELNLDLTNQFPVLLIGCDLSDQISQ
jgi:hypothetical protein